MARLIFSTWWWGTKYPTHYIDRLRRSIARNTRQPHEFLLCEPEAEDRGLVEIPGCFCRLRMFEPRWQEKQGLDVGDRLVCLDLDLIITGELDPVFDRDDSFCILQGANVSNPCPFNGSVMMLKVGAHADVWDDFSLPAARAQPYHDFPDDQGWLWHKIPEAAGWQVGPTSGVWAFQKSGWPKGHDLPPGARIVAFPGWRDPAKFEHVSWVRENWRT